MNDYTGPLAGIAFIVLLLIFFALLGEVIRYFFRRKKVKKAKNPDTPFDELLTLAKTCPEVQKNPIFGILLIQNPSRWQDIDVRCRQAKAEQKKEKIAYYKAFARGLWIPGIMLVVLGLFALFRQC